MTHPFCAYKLYFNIWTKSQLIRWLSNANLLIRGKFSHQQVTIFRGWSSLKRDYSKIVTIERFWHSDRGIWPYWVQIWTPSLSFCLFCQSLEKESNELVGKIVSHTRPCCWCLRTCILCFTDSVYLSSGPTVMFRFKSDALGNAKGFSFNITTEGNEVYIYHDTLQSVMVNPQSAFLIISGPSLEKVSRVL